MTLEIFWRLLGDYERLTQDESVALRDRDFALVNEIHERKPVLFSTLQSLAQALGLDRRNPVLDSRLTFLGLLEESNAAYVAEQLIELTAEQRALEGVKSRLRGFGNAYALAPGREAGAFLAHG